jgi:hypothetical protein
VAALILTFISPTRFDFPLVCLKSTNKGEQLILNAPNKGEQLALLLQRA